MNLQELDKLLTKYYEGDTSDSEEEKLFELILSDHLPNEYSAEKEMILGFGGLDNIPEPDSGFEVRIMAAIDDSENRGRIASLKRRIYSAVAVAATLLIVVSSYFILRNSGEPADTFNDPLLAYNATMEVLQKVSLTLNSGSDVISELSIISETEDNLTLLSEPARLTAKNMEPLKYIAKSMQLLDLRYGKQD